MRCTFSLCQGANTELIERRVHIQVDKQIVIGYQVDDLWLCYKCGGVFAPGVSRVYLWKDKLSKKKFFELLLRNIDFFKEGERIPDIPEPKPRFVQALNPITRRWVKIDTRIGSIVHHKKSKGPYKNIPEVYKNED